MISHDCRCRHVEGSKNVAKIGHHLGAGGANWMKLYVGKAIGIVGGLKICPMDWLCICLFVVPVYIWKFG